MTDVMTQATPNPFRFPRPQRVHGTRLRHLFRHRRSRVSGRVLAAFLTVMIGFLPIGPAFAGESVLEIPTANGAPAAAPPYSSSAGPSSYAGPDAYGTAPGATSGGTASAEPPSTVAANTEPYPPDPNLGSIDDYQNQPGENGRQQQPAGIYFGGGSRPNEPQRSMTTNLIVGGLLVGLVALEMASHHHHR
jgi:hypothetical protein